MLHALRLSARALVAAGLAAVVACGGGGDGPSGNNNPPTITLTADPSLLTVAQRSSGTVTLTLTRGGGFSGAVTLDVTPASPAGITATVSPTTLTGSTTTATLTVDISGSVSPGTYTVSVRASGSGVASSTAGVGVSVTPAPDFSLSVSPATLSTAQGSEVTAGVSIARTNFTGRVGLTLEGAPNGVTGSFNPASAIGDISTLTVTVGATAAPGSYTLTIRGSAAGMTDKTATLRLTVTALVAYDLTASPSTLNLMPGSRTTVVVAIARQNFTGAVSFSAPNLPAAVSATFAPVNATGAQTTMTVDVGASAAPGAYQLAVRGTANGLTDRLLTVPLTVAAPPVASISLALAPTSMSVAQGAAAAVTLNLTRTNFTGSVSFAATGVPGGTTVAFNPPATTASNATATVTVGAGTPLGTHPIAISASGTGVGPASASLILTVTPPATGGASEWQFCSAADVPVFFAFQDGTGAWQRVNPTAQGNVTRFTFNLTSGRGGVAFVQQVTSPLVSPDATPMVPRLRSAVVHAALHRQAQRSRMLAATFHRTSVFYGTAAEMTSLGIDSCQGTQGNKTIAGNVTGIPGGRFAQLSLGGSSLVVDAAAAGPVTFTRVPSGTIDFVGSRSRLNDVPDRVILLRNLNIPDGGSLPQVIDFNGASAFAPASANLTVANAGNDELLVRAQLTTANGQTLAFATDRQPSTLTQRPWSGLPASRTVAGDVFGVTTLATPSFTSAADLRTHIQYLGQVADQTVTLGPNITEPTIIPLAVGTYPRYRFRGDLPLDYRQAVTIGIGGPTADSNTLLVVATGAYLAAVGSSGQYDVVTPDWAGLSGFPVASRLAAGQNFASISAAGWSGLGLITLKPRAGDVLKGAGRAVTINVP
jgi:hypothetical protein